MIAAWTKKNLVWVIELWGRVASVLSHLHHILLARRHISTFKKKIELLLLLLKVLLIFVFNWSCVGAYSTCINVPAHQVKQQRYASELVKLCCHISFGYSSSLFLHISGFHFSHFFMTEPPIRVRSQFPLLSHSILTTASCNLQ
jgi:hypothetical protein